MYIHTNMHTRVINKYTIYIKRDITDRSSRFTDHDVNRNGLTKVDHLHRFILLSSKETDVYHWDWPLFASRPDYRTRLEESITLFHVRVRFIRDNTIGWYICVKRKILTYIGIKG